MFSGAYYHYEWTFSSPVLRAGSQDLRLARQVIVTEGILLSPVMQDEAERSLYHLL